MSKMNCAMVESLGNEVKKNVWFGKMIFNLRQNLQYEEHAQLV